MAGRGRRGDVCQEARAVREARLPRRQQQWRVWRPVAEITALVGVVLLIFYVTGDHAPRLESGRTYTVCDLATYRVEPGARVRVAGWVASSPWGDGATIHQETCSYIGLMFVLSDEASKSEIGREFASALEANLLPPPVPGGARRWRGGFYVVVDGWVRQSRGAEAGSITVESVRSWRYLGDGTGDGWLTPRPARPIPWWGRYSPPCHSARCLP